MAVDAFMYFGKVNNSGSVTAILGETVDLNIEKNCAKIDQVPTAGTIFGIKDYSFDIDNVSTLGSQSGGAGGGKCNMNQVTFNKNVDKGSPTLFQCCAIGSHIDEACIVLRKAGGATDSLKPYLSFWFQFCFVTGVTWAISGDDPIGETITMMYGSLQIKYWKQKKDGTLLDPPVIASWNQVNNQKDPTIVHNDS